MEEKSRSKKGKRKSKTPSSNGTENGNNDEKPEVLIVPSSSSDSQNRDEEEEEDGVQVDEVDDGEEEEAKGSDITNQRSDKPKDDDEREEEKEDTKKKNKNKKDKKNENALYRFPMHRLNRILKSEDSDTRIGQEAVFLINKASEKFLELFCKEGYAYSVLDRKNYVGYQHLSSVVSKRKRFDFLSDFVPEKVKAEDALAEIIPSAET